MIQSWVRCSECHKQQEAGGLYGHKPLLVYEDMEKIVQYKEEGMVHMVDNIAA